MCEKVFRSHRERRADVDVTLVGDTFVVVNSKVRNMRTLPRSVRANACIVL